jgi:Mg2+-importing ATPase
MTGAPHWYGEANSFNRTVMAVETSFVIDQYWALDAGVVTQRLASSRDGLSDVVAESRRTPVTERLGVTRHSDLGLLLRQFRSPLVLLLLAAAVVSMALAERIDSLIIVVIVVSSGLLGFVQERGAVRAIEALRQLVTVHVDVMRDGRVVERAVDDVVPGDVIRLDMGDVVPGDCLLLESNRLTVDESVLTGEAFPVHKESGVMARDTASSDRTNCLFLGSHVASGSASAIVVAVGRNTEFGAIEQQVAQRHLPTSFERGVTAYGMLLIKATAILVIGVFGMNLWLDRSLSESVLFSLALAVGLAPQMLPAIVTLSLSIGARMLAGKKVVVKRLDSIEDFGSVDVLCTDKTGTLTEGSVKVGGTFDALGRHSDVVLERAFWNAHLQEGHTNPIDEAITDFVGHEMSLPVRLAEIPFDFTRKVVSVIVQTGQERVLICKGAVEQVLSRCSMVLLDGRHQPISTIVGDARKTFEDLSAKGLRLLAVAEKSLPSNLDTAQAAEDELMFLGFIAFVDPIKEGVREAIDQLNATGVIVKIITGDNREISKVTADSVGLSTDVILTGSEMSTLSDSELASRVDATNVFVEVDPVQKERIIRALSDLGHTVGFLGDGVNDVAALHAADVGISVDTGVDVAKETADLILLDKSLSVIVEGIQQGRRVFANTLKYVHVTTSANFGNMVSLACATAFLPFLPMLPLQILLLNFLSDVPGMTIATDNVDPERLAQPQRWDIAQVRRFMIVFGLLSTSVDLATFAILRIGFESDAAELRTGWFLVSVLTEIIAMLFLRTSRHVLRSRPSRALQWSSLAVVMVTLALIVTPFGTPFRLETLSGTLLAALAGLVAAYALMTEVLKSRMSSVFHTDTRFEMSQ